MIVACAESVLIHPAQQRRFNQCPKSYSIFLAGDKLVFVHRQEPNAGSEDICKSVFTWKPEIFNTHWHHVLVTVNGCQAAKLYVNSKEVRRTNFFPFSFCSIFHVKFSNIGGSV